MNGKLLFKLIIIGDAAVGKTSLVKNFVKEEFKTDYLPTLGVNIYFKELKINDKNIELSIWDIAGQTGWELMHKSYFRGAEGAIVVFDLTRKKTLDNLDGWMNKINEYIGRDIPTVILGNKKDLKVAIEVKQEHIKKIIEGRKTNYLETSAKTGENVEETFNMITNKIMNSVK